MFSSKNNAVMRGRGGACASVRGRAYAHARVRARYIDTRVGVCAPGHTPAPRYSFLLLMVHIDIVMNFSIYDNRMRITI